MPVEAFIVRRVFLDWDDFEVKKRVMFVMHTPAYEGACNKVVMKNDPRIRFDEQCRHCGEFSVRDG